MYFNRLRNYLKLNSGRWTNRGVGRKLAGWFFRHWALGSCVHSYFVLSFGLGFRSVGLTQSAAYYSIYLIVFFN